MKETFRRLWPYLWRYRRGLALGLAALVLKDLAGAAQPLVIKSAIDSLTGGVRLNAVVQFALLLVALAAVKGIFQYWMRVILIGISRDIEYDLRNDLFRHLDRALAGLLRAHAHRRHHGARHQRPERRAHDARPGHHVLDRDHAHLPAGHRRHALGGLAADACSRCCRRRW